MPSDYKAAREWVSPEPGAGLIRDTPVLIAPSELYAYPGRGGFLVFELDSGREPHSRRRQGRAQGRADEAAAPTSCRRDDGRG